MKQRWLAEWTDEINRHCNINCINSFIHWGARDDAVVRALTSHQCSPGSNSGFDAYVGLNNFTVVGSLLCSERFISGCSGFPLSSKTSISKFQFDQESGRQRTTLWMCYLQIIIYFMLFYFICIHGKDTNCIYSFSCCFKLYSTKTFGFMI